MFDERGIGFFLSVWWFVSAQPNVPTSLTLNITGWGSGAWCKLQQGYREGRRQKSWVLFVHQEQGGEKGDLLANRWEISPEKTEGSIRKQIQS